MLPGSRRIAASVAFAGTLLGASAAAAQPGISAGLEAFISYLLAARAMEQQASSTGAYARLSPDDRRVAQALFEAQAAAFRPTTAPRLSLEQIAARRHKGEPWAEVFKAMKADGVVTDASLGQTLSRFDDAHRPGR